jgi:methionine-rich copper-binding protein CopC
MKKIAFLVMLLLALSWAGAYAQTITITSPNGGETWSILSNHNITWTTTGTVRKVKIEFTAPPTLGTYMVVVDSTDNTGTYPWIIYKVNASTGAKVRITDVDNVAVTDLSDASFTLVTDLNSPDSIWLERIPNAGAPASSNVNYEIWIHNDEPLVSAQIPISWSSTNITIDTASIAFGADFAVLDGSIKTCDLTNRKCNFSKFRFLGGNLVGTGYHKYISFNFVTNGSWDPNTGATVDTTFYGSSRTKFIDSVTVDIKYPSANQFIPRYILQGKVAEVQEIKNSSTLPAVFSLGQNYPNPFNPVTSMEFAVPKASHVKIEVYNLLGQKVKVLVDEELKAGKYQVNWNGVNDLGDHVASGIYFYRMNADNFTDVKKMILLK